MQCSSCGSSAPIDARFCPTCGNELARRGDERRVVTVLFADIVGFTALSEGRDPERVKLVVDRCFALLADDITAFGGRVDKVMGDAIVALFGAPIAHEDDAERAVRAALRMLDTIEHFDVEGDVDVRLRIGVNTGEVLVGGIAAGDDYTAMGDVVNIAARLQTAADPGTVLVGPLTHTQTRDTIRYGPGGHLRLRGRDEIVGTWRALAPVGQPGERRPGPQTTLIGREGELSLLRRVVWAAVRRRRAHLVAVHGESGLGKRRLGAALVDRAQQDHAAIVLAGRCLPYGESNVWWPIAELVRDAVDLEVEANLDEARATVEGAVAELAEHGGDHTIGVSVDALLHLLGYPTPLDDLDPVRATAESARAFRSLLSRLTERAPVIMWLSDLHWADESVLHMLDETLTRLARAPVVLLASGRAEVADRWMPHSSRFNLVSIALDPLDAEAAGRLLDELLGPDIDSEIRADLIERTGGNPLFLEEMARQVADGTSVSALPANIGSVLGARLDSLPEDARAVLEDAAVWGLRGSVAALREMAVKIRDVHDIDTAVAALGLDGLLELDGPRWRFGSTLVRDVAYGRLTKTDRAWRHAGIALTLSGLPTPNPETVAHHLRSSAALVDELGEVPGLPDDLHERAVTWTMRAAAATSGAQATERTRQLLSEALALVDDADPRRAQMLLDRSRAHLVDLEFAAAARDLADARRCIADLGDRSLDVQAHLLSSELAQWDGDITQALDSARQAAKVARELDDPVLAADAMRRIGMVQLFRGFQDEAEASISEALVAYAAAGDRRGLAWARQNLAWISYLRGAMAEAEERLVEAIATFDDVGDRAGVSWSRGLLAYVRIYEGRLEEADELAMLTLADARERGDNWGEGMMLVALATVALWTGRIDDAVRTGERARDVFRHGADPVGTTQTVAVLGRALVRAGRVAQGVRMFHEASAALDTADGPGDVLATAALAAAATVGDVEGIDADFIAVANEPIDLGLIGATDRVVSAALLGLQAGDLSRATALLGRLPPPGETSGSTWSWAVGALAAVASGDDPTNWIEAVEGDDRATYADRVLARVAGACRAARNGDEPATRAALASADAAVPPGGDRIHPVIVAVAREACVGALGAADADAVGSIADRCLDTVGVDGAGWRRAFGVVLGSSVAANDA